MPGHCPAGLVAAWVSNWIWLPIGLLTVVFSPLLFPTGRSVSSRWRRDLAGRCHHHGLDGGGALTPALAVADERSVANPIGVPAPIPTLGWPA
jgi:hypothetical protein